MIPIETLKIIEELEALIEAERMKFMGFVRLDEEQFLELTGRLRASLPEDIQRATRLTENTERMLETAQSEATRVIMEGRSDAQKTLDEAKREGEKIRELAKADATRTIDEAKELSASLIEQSEILRIATVQAREIVAQAETEAKDLRIRVENEVAAVRLGADEYAADVLLTLERNVQEAFGNLEHQATSILATIQRGKKTLDRARPQPKMPTQTADLVASNPARSNGAANPTSEGKGK